jgi:hypothetical protein
MAVTQLSLGRNAIVTFKGKKTSLYFGFISFYFFLFFSSDSKTSISPRNTTARPKSRCPALRIISPRVTTRRDETFTPNDGQRRSGPIGLR